MKVREVTVPYVTQEIDYAALSEAIEQAFAEEYGMETVNRVRVGHFNPDVIDATVVIGDRKPGMDNFALMLAEAFRRQGIRVAIRVASAKDEAA